MSILGSEAHKAGHKEPVVACHDIWKSCWMQGELQTKYQPVFSTARIPKIDTPFNPSNFQPASVFLKSWKESSPVASSVDTGPPPTASTGPPQTVSTGPPPSTSTGPTPSASTGSLLTGQNTAHITTTINHLPQCGLSIKPSSDDNFDAFNQSYEYELRRNASISLGLSNKHLLTRPLLKALPVASYQSPLVYSTQYRPPNSSSNSYSKHDINAKRLDYLKQHLLMSSPGPTTTSCSLGTASTITTNSTVAPKSSTNTVTSNRRGLMDSLPSNTTLTDRFTADCTGSYPLQYGTLQPKSKSKPRPLRSGTLQRHKSSAEIYLKSASSASSPLNRLLSVSAEDIRKSLKVTNGALQRLLATAFKKTSAKSLPDTDGATDQPNSCCKLGG